MNIWSEQKIAGLLRSMTMAEKVALLSMRDMGRTQAIERVGIRELTMYDGPHGVRAEKTTTGFPTGVAMAATWNPELIRRVGVALADETLANGGDLLLGPCVNIVRHPLSGRNFETYSEDPCLAGEIGAAWVTGLQSRGVGASLKHYACNNQETRRDRASSVVDERTMREIYLTQFEIIVKRAKPWTIMAALNRVNGIYASENRHLLTEILREEWGFDGVVLSDCEGTHTTVESVRGGLDLELPGPAKFFGARLVEALNSWQIEPAAVDEAARRMLRLLARAGKLGAPRRAGAGATNTPAHQALARSVAEEAIVLLKNEGGILPLDPAALRSIAVIGPTAAVAPMGAGSSKNATPYRSAPLDALREALPKQVRIEHEPGVDNAYEIALAEAGWVRPLKGAGHGWSAEFFDNLEWAGKPAGRAVESQVHFWRHGSPPFKGVPWDRYSARWTGILTVPHTGRYRFKMACMPNSLLRLLADGKLLGSYAPQAGDTALPGFTVDLELVAGRSCRLCVEYVKLPTKEAAYAQMKFIPLAPAGFEAGLRRAAELAARCDAALLFVGLPEALETESCDRPHLDLTGAQEELIRAVARANPRTVVVLNCGAPVAMPWLACVPAVALAWYPNQEGGRAIARVLLGAADPGGRLPVTFPKRLEDSPAFGYYPGEREVRYGEGIFVGYRHFDKHALEPLFPFGFGLSYTQFEYSGLRLPGALGSDQRLKVSLRVRNTGRRAGSEVVQLYVGDPLSALPRPLRELKAFRKLLLKPGQSRQVEFALNARDFSYYDPARRSWVLEAGTFEIMVGRSSRDIRLRAEILAR